MPKRGEEAKGGFCERGGEMRGLIRPSPPKVPSCLSVGGELLEDPIITTFLVAIGRSEDASRKKGKEC